jgi:hypothetical protein
MRERRRLSDRVAGRSTSEDEPHEEPHLQVEEMDDNEREREAMDEVMTNYFVEDDLTFEDDELQPRHGHSRERLWEEAQQHAHARIFYGSRLSVLSAILEILNLQTRYKASNIMLDDLFRLLHDLILPSGNSMPGSWVEAKKVLKSIGMEYQIIHACPNDCVLYRCDHASKLTCPECDTPRYKDNMVTNKVPQKAMRYFPLIPRLLHTYRCSDLAELQVWHSKHRSSDGIMRMAVDSPASKYFEEEWPEFGRDPRNVRLGLATDGISPFNLAGKAQPYSVWPVVLMNYNIPPWLSMKKGHLLLSMIIPGPKQPTTLDVYLAPLLDELKDLWDGVPAYDNRPKTDRLPRNFSLKAALMWSMHDYPGTLDFG